MKELHHFHATSFDIVKLVERRVQAILSVVLNVVGLVWLVVGSVARQESDSVRVTTFHTLSNQQNFKKTESSH